MTASSRAVPVCSKTLQRFWNARTVRHQVVAVGGCCYLNLTERGLLRKELVASGRGRGGAPLGSCGQKSLGSGYRKSVDAVCGFNATEEMLVTYSRKVELRFVMRNVLRLSWKHNDRGTVFPVAE